jgi:hypothetical protein
MDAKQRDIITRQDKQIAALKKQLAAQKDAIIPSWMVKKGCTLTCGTECFDGQPCNKEGK